MAGASTSLRHIVMDFSAAFFIAYAFPCLHFSWSMSSPTSVSYVYVFPVRGMGYGVHGMQRIKLREATSRKACQEL